MNLSLAVNLHRRHLEKGQRAMVGVEYKKRRKAIAEEAKTDGRRLGGMKAGRGRPLQENSFAANSPQSYSEQGSDDPHPVDTKPAGRAPASRDVAAKAVGVSGKTIDHAEKVVDHGIPALIEMVKSGEVAVSAASSVSDEPIPESPSDHAQRPLTRTRPR